MELTATLHNGFQLIYGWCNMLKSGRSVSLHIIQKILGLIINARAHGESRVPGPKISRIWENYRVSYTILITESPAIGHASEIAHFKLFLVLGHDRKNSAGKPQYLTKEFLPRYLPI